MKTRYSIVQFLAALTTSASLFSQTPAAAPKEEIVELPAFSISSEKDTG